MKINRDLAQYIIDYNKKIVRYQINIMNPDAVIIASTNPARIGKHHFGAPLRGSRPIPAKAKKKSF